MSGKDNHTGEKTTAAHNFLMDWSAGSGKRTMPGFASIQLPRHRTTKEFMSPPVYKQYDQSMLDSQYNLRVRHPDFQEHFDWFDRESAAAREAAGAIVIRAKTRISSKSWSASIVWRRWSREGVASASPR
ncbi:MAG: hypothetical protein IIA41_13575 [SAR324 cluster bacterium]|nr:hypothetical protein [SAR324 cluster bacterium]